MRVREYREAIADNVRRIRRSNDLELVKKVTDSIIAFNSGFRPGTKLY